MQKIFQFLAVSLVLAACNSSPYSYYTAGARCDEASSPNPVVMPPTGTTARYVEITNSLTDPTVFPPGTYKFASLGAFFQDKQSDLHIYVSQGVDSTTNAATYGVPCIRNYNNVNKVPSTNVTSDMASVTDLSVDSNQTITGNQSTLGYKIAGGVAPVPGPSPSPMAGNGLAGIAAVYSAQNMDIFKIYKVTDLDSDGNYTNVTYQIRAQKANDAQKFALRQIRVSMVYVAPTVAAPTPSPTPSPSH